MAEDETTQLEVPPAASETRLDRFLAVPLGSRSRAQSLIAARRVRVNGRARANRHIVRPGDVIEIDASRETAAPAGGAADYAIAYEDDQLIVVDKPAGVVVHPAKGHRSGTLAQALAGRAAGGEEWRAGIVHRLDRDTSGLLVVAKSEETHRALKSLLARRVLHREYLTLVDGHPEARTGTIEAPIGRHRRDRVMMAIDGEDPREARTRFQIERLLSGASLLRVILETGRTHQIRVHMAAIGHPVCGDPLYGVAGRYGLSRQFLHAARLSFEHPWSGEKIDVSSPLPDDLAAALREAERV